MTVIATGDYEGATEDELHHLSLGRKIVGMVDQRRLFPHHGVVTLEDDRLVLESWLEIPKVEIASISLEFTDVYTRFMAGGTRGQFPSLGVIGDKGKPLIIRRTGEARSSSSSG